MKKSYIFSLCAAAAILTGCSKEDPFGSYEEGTGQFLKSALSVDLNADGFEYRKTRAEADINDFTVLFFKDGEAQPVAKYLYGEMPEIVTLPAGSYTCTATYGQNLNAEWESPYFLGNSEKFEISPFEITSYIEPIVCNLENIKVTIDFDRNLRAHMSEDSYVEVKVGTSTSLKYGVLEADAQKAGYFMHSDEITLVAVFHGTVDGAEIIETKSMQQIKKGAHYRITFKLHEDTDSDITGSLQGDVKVDANVTVVNVNTNVTLGEDEVMDDSERPVEGQPSNPGGQDPEKPDQPDQPKTEAPTITSEAPVNLEIVNNGSGLATCILHINSTADQGITELTCDIDSEQLADVLEPMGMMHLNLAETPESYKATLDGWGFPTNVKGSKDVKFEITGDFLEMLGGLGNYQHNFTITVKDANGQCVKTLKLKF